MTHGRSWADTALHLLDAFHGLGTLTKGFYCIDCAVPMY